MRTYQETVNYLAERMYHQYMGGAMGYSNIEGLSAVAYAYDMDQEKLFGDIRVRFEEIRTARKNR